MRISEATSDAEIKRCFSVMLQLRPHLHKEEFLTRIRRQQAEGFRLAYVLDEEDEGGGGVRAVAGFRVHGMLHSGRTMYVDDLVTEETSRDQGYGSVLFDWLVSLARAEGCDAFTLDSGFQRTEAHRFYLHKGMTIRSLHFHLDLS